MTAPHAPRTAASVLVEEDADSFTVTWGLGDPVETPLLDYFGYGMDHYDPTGNRGKRFGVRFSTEASSGFPEIGTIAAYAHIEGRDEQLGIPVSLLR